MKRMVTISGTEDSVVRPIVKSVSTDLLKILNIDNKGVVIKFNDIPILMEHESGPSTLDKTLRSEIIEVNIKEEAIQELELTRPPLHPDSTPFYNDPETHTSAQVAYRSIKINFELKVQSKSKSFINKIIDLLHVFKIEGAMHNHHNIQLLINIPNITLLYLKEIYDIKKSVDTNLTMDEFMSKTLNKNYLDELLSLDGKESRTSLIIKEYQSDVLGYFLGEFTEVEKDKDGIYYILPLNYIIQYQKPISVHMNFPYLIYNKRLSKDFIKPTVNYVEKNFRNHEKELMQFLETRPSFGINKQGYYLTYPRNDDFTVADKLFAYCPIISMLCVVDENNPCDLFNVLNMGAIDFIDAVKEFIILQREFVTRYQQSLFYFSLYEDECLKSNMLTLDELGNLKTTKPMSIKSTYRVMIYICCDISVIPMPNRKTILDFLNNDLKLRGGAFLDSYLSFFNLDRSKVYDVFKNLDVKSPGGLLLKLKLGEYSWPKYNAQHHTEVYRLLKE